jgi:hypothetical protein
MDACAFDCHLVVCSRIVVLYPFSQPIEPGLKTFSCAARKRKGDQTRVEQLNAALEVLHIKINVRQEVGLVDHQGVNTAVHGWVFVGFIVAFWDRGDKNVLVGAQFKSSRADKIAHVLDQKQIVFGQVELVKGTSEHDGVEMALPPGIDLDRFSTGSYSSIGIDAGGNVAIYNYPTNSCY